MQITITLMNPKRLELRTMEVLAKASSSSSSSSTYQQLPDKITRSIERYRRILNNTCDECVKVLKTLVCEKYGDSIETSTATATFNSTRFIKALYIEYLNHFQFCKECVMKSMDGSNRLQHHQHYLDRLVHLLSDENYWENYLHQVLELDDEADIIDWNFKMLTLEQALVLKNYPEHRLPAFCDEYMRVVSSSYTTTWKSKKYFSLPKYCSLCVTNHIGETTEDADDEEYDEEGGNAFRHVLHTTRVCADHIIEQYFWDDSEWCSDCKYTPLFSLVYEDDDIYDTDIIYLLKCNTEQPPVKKLKNT